MFSSIGNLICIPFAWLVRVFYNMTQSYGIAIILFTVVIKLIMLPFQMKSKRSMMRMSRLSGRMQELQKKYANNQMKLQEEMQKLYAEEGVNPMSGCLWSFIPLPILIALYSIIRQPITHFMSISSEIAMDLANKAAAAGMDMTNILTTAKNGDVSFNAYGQINLAREISLNMPQLAEGVDGWININYDFIGLDLASTPWNFVKDFSFSWAVIGLILIPILAGASQMVMSWYTMRNQSSSQQNAGSMKTMMYMMPLMSVYFAFVMPAALGVYWIAQSVFSLIQEILMNKFFTKKMEAEENARAEAIESDRKRRQEAARIQQEERKNQQEQKKTLKEKQKAAQEAKMVKKNSTTEAGRVGERPYARGRAYKEDRYDG